MFLHQKAAVALAAFLCVSTAAFAQISIDGCETVFSENTVTITGKTDAAGANVLLTVYESGSGKDAFAGALGWQNMLTADETGAFSDTFVMEGAGIYTAVAATADESAKAAFAYTDKKRAAAAIAAVNAATDTAAALRANADALGLRFAEISAAPDDTAIAAYVKNVLPLNAADIDAAIKQLQQFSLFGYIKNNQVENVFDFAQYLDIYEIENNGIFKEPFFTDAHKADATDRIGGKSIADFNDFSDKIREAMILAVVKNPDGFGNVKKVLWAHSGFVGIAAETASDSVYRGLANRNFGSIAELKAAFSELTAGQKGQTSGGGNRGGGGSGGSGGNYNVDVKIDPVAPSIPPVNAGIDGVFADLSGFDWAKEAIRGLYAKQVVRGKADGVFAPRDRVTRAEFVKMLTAALEIPDGEGDMQFADVSPGDWAYPYIKKAYQAGIVNGISDTLFGGNAYISRQDMAAMVCRALAAAGRRASGSTEEKFADDMSIAAYAGSDVYALKAMGVLTGDADGYFRPNDSANRAEAAKVIYEISK